MKGHSMHHGHVHEHLGHPHHAHAPIKLALSPAQLSKVRNGHPIQIPHHAIGHASGHTFKHLHPLNHEKILKAYRAKKGVRVHLTHHELHGTGIWDTIKSGFNKYVKPVLSGVGDALAYANPELAGIREGVRGLTGVGIVHHKHGRSGHHQSLGMTHGGIKGHSTRNAYKHPAHKGIVGFSHGSEFRHPEFFVGQSAIEHERVEHPHHNGAHSLHHHMGAMTLYSKGLHHGVGGSKKKAAPKKKKKTKKVHMGHGIIPAGYY